MTVRRSIKFRPAAQPSRRLVLFAASGGGSIRYLSEPADVAYCWGKLLDIVLPDHVALKVVETATPQKGGSQATFKPARLEGGLEIMVPLFIGPDEIIRVDTRERKYLGKENVE